MELGDATVLETSSGEVSPAGINGGEGREGGGGGEEEVQKINVNGGGGGGNRWPRQETLALLKIRSDMDGVFRDASLKGPLWEEVSRKLAQLGYQRSAKKCKEKFENVYKYHRRTKESRSGKSEGKTYRFFDQLQALEKPFTLSSYPPKPSPATLPITTNPLLTLPSDPISHVTVPSTNPTTLISPSPPKPTNVTTITSTTLTTNPTNPSQDNNNNNNNNGNSTVQYSLPNMNLFSTTTTTTTTTSTSSSTASDEDLEEKYRKKRKWKDYFRRLTREVLAKQEEMQKRFLESIDKREREQMAQQDAWRLQEMARINREHDLLVQERSTAAAKNAAVIAFLQKLSTHQNPTTPQQQQPRWPQPPQPPKQPQPPLSVPPSQPTISQPQLPHHQPLIVIPQPNNNVEVKAMNNGHRNGGSRWPKAEVHALIRLRTSLEPKYLENGPKAPLWEDISAGMQRLGYNRSSKRCKEKWENINKYFKKVKESNKQRREDSKTCPYFHELEALYKEKGKTQNPFGSGSFHNMKQNEMMEPLMVQPEQQWRPPPQEGNVVEKKNEEVVAEGGEEEEEYDDEDEYESMEEDEQGYDDEVTTNKPSSVDIVE